MIKSKLSAQDQLLQRVLDRLEMTAEGGSDLPDGIQLPLKSMEEIDSLEEKLSTDATLKKQLVS